MIGAYGLKCCHYWSLAVDKSTDYPGVEKIAFSEQNVSSDTDLVTPISIWLRLSQSHL